MFIQLVDSFKFIAFSTFVRGLVLHLFEDYIYDYRHKPRFFRISRFDFFRQFIVIVYNIMVASTSAAVPCAQDEDGSRLRAVLDRTT